MAGEQSRFNLKRSNFFFFFKMLPPLFSGLGNSFPS